MTIPQPPAAEIGYRLSKSAGRDRPGFFAPLCQTLMVLLLFAGFGISSLLVASLIQVFE